MYDRSEHNTPQNLIDEYLAKGGQVNICPPCAKTEDIEYTNSFHRKKKPSSTTVDNNNNSES
jgi:hypothetical protein